MPPGITLGHSNAGTDGPNTQPPRRQTPNNVRVKKETLENLGFLGIQSQAKFSENSRELPDSLRSEAMHLDTGSLQRWHARSLFIGWPGAQTVHNRVKSLAIDTDSQFGQAPFGATEVKLRDTKCQANRGHVFCQAEDGSLAPIFSAPLQFFVAWAYTRFSPKGKAQLAGAAREGRSRAMAEMDHYDYELPKELIAQAPTVCRTDARMLVVDRKRKSLEHKHIRDLPEILRANDCLVINDTRVVPARLVGSRQKTGGHWEGLFLDASDEGFWRVLCKTRGKLQPGDRVVLTSAADSNDVELELVTKLDGGMWVVKPLAKEAPLDLLERVGRVPLPPYIRQGKMVESDRENYQTVFAEVPGAVAAPTAGLHFTTTLLDRLASVGVELCRLTLHVGTGTFRPITAETLAEHQMHSEWGHIAQESVDHIENCRKRGGRVVAVGTTSVRVLETAAASGHLKPFGGSTELFIRPPYKFHAVDVLLTNFHLPRTTLLVLVRTFGGDELIRHAYEEAIREKYRFYSYGDAMLIL
jgi:S-adenosylmethionine:tRNA ribosyltransferase-isomerase